MSKETWNEAGRIWEEDHTWLDDEQRAKCGRAHESGTFPSPIPTQMISNGEYMPAPQTKKQQQVESRIKELVAEWEAGKLPAIDLARIL